MPYYDSFAVYIRSASDLEAKITRIDAIITALEDSALDAAATQKYDEYSLDDGQSKIKTSYRSIKDIKGAIDGFMQLRQFYVNRRNGRITRLVDLHSHM